MNIDGPAKVICVYIGSSDKWNGANLYNAIVQEAKSRGMAGATVTEAIEGYGANSRIHRASLLDISSDLPIKVEIVDTEERVNAFLPIVEEMVVEGLITVHDCDVVRYVHGDTKGLSDSEIL